MSGDKRLLELAQKLHAIHRNRAPDLPAALVELTSAAASAIPGAAYAGITLVTHDGDVETPAASHEYAALLDDIQQKHREGPCLHAARHGEAVLVTNIATDDRWPRYRREALNSTPVRSVLSLPMPSDTGGLGALNAFAEQAEAFDDTSGNVATAYAALGALAWGSVVLQRQMTAAVQSRDIIGQAKGMLMERYRIDAQQAFAMLRRRSQSSNVPLRIVAGELVAAGSRTETDG
jgi:transcriptional regulator with GAF, ATPase, and Fis domain